MFLQSVLPRTLSPEEERTLFNLARKGDANAREQLIVHNIRLIHFVMRRLSFDPNDVDDVVSCGAIGLIKAVDSYKTDSGVAFSTFAATCIRNEILVLHFRLKRKSRLDDSFDDIVESGGEFSSAFVADVEDEVIRRIETEDIMRLFDKYLTRRQKEILVRRLGLDGDGVRRQCAIANELDITYDGVWKSENRSLAKLRELAGSIGYID